MAEKNNTVMSVERTLNLKKGTCRLKLAVIKNKQVAILHKKLQE